MFAVDAPPLPPSSPVEISLSAETLDVGPAARMGLLGLGYQRQFDPHWRAGVAVYGASRGDRGGFFAWGLNGAWQTERGPWRAEAGLFAGGGGGSPGWVGGGLMLRPHLEISHAWADWRLGAGWSQVWFPDGLVRSSQPYLALHWRGEHLSGPADAAQAPVWPRGQAWQVAPTALEALGGVYQLQRPARRDGQGGRPALQFGGLAWRQAWPGTAQQPLQPYTVLSTVGAMGGGHDGYAELSGGLGVQGPLAADWVWRAEAALGSAGAGATVDTGGGLIAKWGLALGWQATPDWGLSLQTGGLRSRGPFDAREWRLALAWRGLDVLPGAPGAEPPADAPPAGLHWSPWRVQAGLQHYPRMLRDSGQRSALQTLSLGLARQLDAHWRLLADAGTGVGGDAGGYATGRLGLGWQSAPLGAGGWRLGGEATLGAAGGGGVVVSGGLYGQAQLQAVLPLAGDWGLQADAGWLRSARGALSSPFVGVALVSRFARLQAR